MVRSTSVAVVVLCAAILVTPRFLHAQPATRPATAPASAAPLPLLGNTSVSIPWQELAALLEKIRETPARPPVDFVFSPAAYSAEVNGETAAISAEIDVTLLREGFVLVPLASADVAVDAVEIDGQPASLVLRDGQLAALISGPGKKKIALTAKRPVTSDAGVARFELPLASSPINTLTVTVPGSADIRATSAGSAATAEKNNKTTLTATYRGGAVAAVSWKQRPQQAAAGEARVYSDAETRVNIRRGLVRYTTTLHTSVERGAVKSLKVRVDPKAVLLSVAGKDVTHSDEAAANDARTVTINFASPLEGSRDLVLTYEKDVPEAGGATPIVSPAVEGARRDGGVISVEADGAYEVRPAEGTLERISVSELPAGLRSPAATLAYRYATAASAQLALTPVKPLPTKLFALTQTRVAIDRGVLRCQANVAYEIQNAGVDTFRITLPAGAELVGVEGAGVRDTQVVEENKSRILVVGLKDVAKKQYALTVNYDVHFEETPATAAPAGGGDAKTKPLASRPATMPASRPAKDAGAAAAIASTPIPIIDHPDAVKARGYVGIEVRGGYELSTTVAGANRVDVKELPAQLWSMASAPMLEGYRYEAGTPTLTLAVTRHEDLDVLVAMSDVCEASTTFTPDGRSVTKLMYVVRNNLKPFMALKLPEGAQVWSTFVDDRPVTPVKTADGRVLVPLKKSQDVDEDDDESYKAKRDRRRKGEDDQRKLIQKAQQLRAEDGSAADLKPYDVEIVFVMPAVQFAQRGQLDIALPQSDIPVGHLAWAVFLPKHLRLVDSQGNVNEVAHFTLPFRHFADVEYVRAEKLAQAQQALQQAEAMKKLQDQAQKMAEAAKVAGVLPVRVEVPIAGEIFRFEKLLVVDEMPKATVTYARKLE